MGGAWDHGQSAGREQGRYVFAPRLWHEVVELASYDRRRDLDSAELVLDPITQGAAQHAHWSDGAELDGFSRHQRVERDGLSDDVPQPPGVLLADGPCRRVEGGRSEDRSLDQMRMAPGQVDDDLSADRVTHDH